MSFREPPSLRPQCAALSELSPSVEFSPEVGAGIFPLRFTVRRPKLLPVFVGAAQWSGWGNW